MKKRNINSTDAELLPDHDDCTQNRKGKTLKKIKQSIYSGSAVYLLLIVIVCAFVGEVLIGLLSYSLPHFSQFETVLFDSILLLIPTFPILYIFVYRPITAHIAECKQAEEELKNNLSSIEAILESIHNGILVVSPQGTVIKSNAKFAEMWQIPDYVIASGNDKTLMDSVLGQLTDPDGFITKVNELYRNTKAKSIDSIYLKDGRIFKRISRPKYLDGEPNGRVWSFLDITERIKAEKALRDSEEKYRYMFVNNPQPMCIYDRKTLAFLEVNQVAVNHYGYSKEEFLSMTLYDIRPVEDLSALQEDLELTGNSNNYSRERRHIKKNGDLIFVEISAHSITRNGRDARHVLIQDITARKRVEAEIKLKNEELQKINAEKDKFFSIIAHDLRSPFNGFLGLTRIMTEELPSLTMVEIQEIAEIMKSSATNLFRLLENLLEWARMKQGLIPFEQKLVDLLPIVDESIKIAQEPAKTKGIKIAYDVPDKLKVFADTNILQTIIRNLVSNAVKFTSKGGKISVLAKADDNNGVEISVKDTGIGMSCEMINNLFRLDVQTNRKGTEDEPSSGLGLLLCKEFVEKHGGRIWVESEEGRGSTFYFTISNKGVM